MTKEEYRQSCLDVVYLAACAVNGETPDQGSALEEETPI